MRCSVCGGRDFVASEYVAQSALRAPALRCVGCEAIYLDEAVARSPEERESIRLAKAERAKSVSGSMSPIDKQRAALASAPSVVRSGGGRVLLVDDEDEVREAQGNILRRNGWAVTAEGDPAQARKRVRQEKFDVIVTDLVMPGLTGVDLLRAVREHDLDVPVIILTGRPDVESAMDALQYGAFRYMAKPVATSALLEVVQRAKMLHAMALYKREALALAGVTRGALGDRASLEARMSSALDSLWMAYQPIVSMSDKRVVGYEALMRTGEATLQSPLDLIETAERLGRLNDLGRKARARIAEDAAGLPEGALMFVNIHPEDLRDADLVSAKAPLSGMAGRVVLEMTERASLDRVAGLQTCLGRLRELGYKIGLDDLGTGYAGLASFTLLEPDYVKLDASLIRAIDESPPKRTLVKAMLQLADKDLALEVICEGVETLSERWTLMSLGANLFQGHLFARPSAGFDMPVW